MKAQCERCKEIVELRFAVGDGGIDVECGECAARYFVAAPVAGEPARPAEGKPCPKCGHRQLGGEACKKCGLVFGKWVAPVVAGAAGESDVLWDNLESRWDDEAAHEAVLASVQRSGQFAWLAGKYRQARERMGAAAEPMAGRAVARLEKVALTTLVMGGTSKAQPAGEGHPYRKSMVILVTLLILVGAGLAWVLMTRRPARDELPERPAVPRSRAKVGP